MRQARVRMKASKLERVVVVVEVGGRRVDSSRYRDGAFLGPSTSGCGRDCGAAVAGSIDAPQLLQMAERRLQDYGYRNFSMSVCVPDIATCDGLDGILFSAVRKCHAQSDAVGRFGFISSLPCSATQTPPARHRPGTRHASLLLGQTNSNEGRSFFFFHQGLHLPGSSPRRL